MTTTAIRPPASNAPPVVPPLRDGDRMDADEFVRRWEAMPEPRPRAELLDGSVCLHTMTIREEFHGGPQAHLLALLAVYYAATAGTYASAPASMRHRPRQMPEPDGFLRILETHGGQAKRAEDGYLDGAAELVVEIAASSERIDLGRKFDVYRRMGVQEYVVWRTEAGVIDWYVRREDRFDPLPPGEDGIARSEVFPGLWLDVAALVRGELGAALAMLQKGLATPEHAAFVERLKAAAQA